MARKIFYGDKKRGNNQSESIEFTIFKKTMSNYNGLIDSTILQMHIPKQSAHDITFIG